MENVGQFHETNGTKWDQANGARRDPKEIAAERERKMKVRRQIEAEMQGALSGIVGLADVTNHNWARYACIESAMASVQVVLELIGRLKPLEQRWCELQAYMRQLDEEEEAWLAEDDKEAARG